MFIWLMYTSLYDTIVYFINVNHIYEEFYSYANICLAIFLWTNTEYWSVLNEDLILSGIILYDSYGQCELLLAKLLSFSLNVSRLQRPVSSFLRVSVSTEVLFKRLNLVLWRKFQFILRRIVWTTYFIHS